MDEQRFEKWTAPKINDGEPTQWGWIVRHVENFSLGENTDIGAFCYINALRGVTIEENVQIGSHCSIYSVSTIDNKSGPVVLKKNCKIGTHSVVMPGVVIGENAVVGAFSFVNKDVAAGARVAGVPVKPLSQTNGTCHD